jgi:hypothetical protein
MHAEIHVGPHITSIKTGTAGQALINLVNIRVQETSSADRLDTPKRNSKSNRAFIANT